MEVELFVHGTPLGADFWGKKEDKNYFVPFYNGSSDELKFLIQIRPLNGKPYCYYNYMVYKDVICNNGRSGGYFGISLRFDAYCNDAMTLYRILDTIYNVYVLGKILKADKSKLRYTTQNFESVSGYLKNIEDTALQLVQKAFVNESFVGLNGFSTGNGNDSVRNLYDCTNESILSTIRQYGKIAISPYYPSDKEKALQKECETRIQTLQKQCEDRYQAEIKMRVNENDELKTSLSSTQQQVAGLQSDISQRDETITRLNEQLSKLDTQIKNTARNKNIASIVKTIEAPITDLAKILRNIEPGTHKGRHDSRKDKMKEVSISSFIRVWLPVVNFILLALIAFALCFPSSKSEKAEDTEQESDKIETFDNSNQGTYNQSEDPYIEGDTPTDQPPSENKKSDTTPFNMPETDKSQQDKFDRTSPEEEKKDEESSWASTLNTGHE